MKTNKNLVLVDVQKQVTNITTTFSIPFMDRENDFEDTAAMNWDEVLYRFSEVIVKALEDRMAACMAMLSKNLFNVVHSNEHTIVYKKRMVNTIALTMHPTEL